MRKILGLLTLLCAVMASLTASYAASPLAPTGTLRVGIVRASQASPQFCTIDAEGKPHGIPADLGTALARQAGVPVSFVILANSGEVTDAVANGTVDVAFIPVDAARSARVAFGPGYYVVESTFLVTAASGIKTMQEVDRAGVRVIGIADTTTIRAATRALHNTVPVPVRLVDDAVAMVQDGRADALCLSHESLKPLVAKVPGSRIVDGSYQRTTISIAVPQGRPEALATASAFLTAAKQDGTVRRAMDAVGMQGEPIAP